MMRKFAAIGFLITLITSCVDKGKEVRTGITSLTDVFQKLAPKTQTFLIDPTRDTIIEGRYGVRVFIPANSLQFENGILAKVKLTIGLKEYTTTSEMIAENLVTLNHGQNFETAGMIYLDAWSNGQKIIIKEGKKLGIYFPEGENRKTHMRFYEGEKNSTSEINWKLRPDTAELSKSMFDSSIWVKKKCGIQITGFVIGFGSESRMLEGERLSEIVSWKFRNVDGDIFNFFDRYFDKIDFKSNECDVCRDVTLDVEIATDASGIAKIKKYTSDAPNLCKVIVSNFIDSLPALDSTTMGRKTGDGYSLSFSFSNQINRRKFNSTFTQEYESSVRPHPKRVNKSYYTHYLSQFGWVNFANESNFVNGNVNFQVKDSTDRIQKILLLLEEERAHSSASIRDGVGVFHGIPKHRPARVFGIGYIDGKLYLAVAQTYTTKAAFTLPPPREVTFEEFRKELNNFDFTRRIIHLRYL